MNLPIPNDMCRCGRLQCKRYDTCARYKTMEVDERGRTFSFASELCAPVDDKQQDFYIEMLP